MVTQAYYDHIKEVLAEDLETTNEVIEHYLGSIKPVTKAYFDGRVYIGGGEILPCWPLTEECV